jgi:hypothetical protein
MTSGDVVVKLNDFSLEWIGKVNFSTDPQLFYGEGNGWFNLSKLNVTTKMNFDKGANMLPKLILKSSKVDISNTSVGMHFDGTNDIFQLMDMAKNFTLPMIVDFISGEMKAESIKFIEDTINGALEGLPHEITIPNTHVALDYGFTFAPSVTKDGYVPIPIAGAARCTNETSCKKYEKRPIPPKEEDYAIGKGSLQLHISDYILNSVFVAAFEDSLLNFYITPEFVHGMTNGSLELDTDLFGILIPEIRRRYGPKRPISISITATQPPEVTITSAGLEGKSY